MRQTRALLTTVLVAAVLPLAWAQSVTYANRTVPIRAGVVVTESGGSVLPQSPHVWSVLDRDTLVKPAEWRFEAGVPKSRVTAFDATFRWAGTPAGLPLGKGFGPYWELSLPSASVESLSEYDALFLPMGPGSVLSSRERELLRGFVDRGGFLWVDYLPLAVGFDAANPMVTGLVPFLSTSALTANLSHPVMQRPNRMTFADTLNLGSESDTTTALRRLSGADLGSSLALKSQVVQESLKEEAVVATSNGATVTVSQVGEGFILSTARGVSESLTATATGLNNGFEARPAARTAPHVASLKLLVNALSLSSRFSGGPGGSRASSGTSATVSAPALRRFAAPLPAPSGQVALYGGYTVATVGQRVVVFDTVPSRDADGDGNPDDGPQDSAAGSPFDVVWQSAPLGSVLSDPVVVEASGTPVAEQIWVVGENSVAYCFSLDQTGAGDPLNVAPFAAIAPPSGTATGGRRVAPTYHEGILFVADRVTPAASNLGRVWAINVRRVANGDGNASKDVDDNGGLGTAEWSVGGASQMRAPGRSLAVGYIPIDDNSGGMDRVVYVGYQRSSSGPAGLSSLWLGARGEAPVQVDRTGADVRVTTRAQLQRLPLSLNPGSDSPFGLRVSVSRLDAGGTPVPFTTAQMNTFFDGSVLQPSEGVLSLRLTAAGQASSFDWDGRSTPGDPSDDVFFRVDYTIDWTVGAAGASNYVRGNVDILDQATPRLDLVGGPVLAESGNVGMVFATEPGVSGAAGGSYYNFEENGRGEFFVRSRFEFHNQITNLGAVGSSTPYPPALIDNDEIVRILPFLNRPMRNMRPVGIASRHGQFYVTASGEKDFGGFGAPTSAVLVFESAPADVEFQVELGAPLQPDTTFVLKQGDPARNGYGPVMSQFSNVPSNSFRLEQIPGTTRARVSLRSLATSTKGSLNSCLATNLPVIIVRQGQVEQLVEPEAPGDSAPFVSGRAGGRYSHLVWYTVLNGFVARTAPVVTGETMFVAGRSLLPQLFRTGSPFPLTFNGLVFGLDSRLAPDDPFLVSSPARPWQNQLWSLRSNVQPPVPFSFNVSVPTAFRWPQVRGIQSVDDLAVRFLQVTLPDSDISGLSAGDGAVVASGDVSMTGFTRSDFVVADAGRVTRFDPSGNPLWSLEASYNSGREGAGGVAERARRLSVPTRVYPDGANGYVVVDSGADAILRLDGSGREVRTVQTVRIHPDVFATTDPARPERSPRGAGPSSARLLRNPQDVVFWSTTVRAADVQRLFPSEGAYRTYTNERWDHWLIADAGNGRVVELIDRYALDAQGRVSGVVRYRDPSGNEGDGGAPALGILWWHTPEEFTGRSYAFNTIARATLAGPTASREVFALGFNNVEPGSRTFGLDSAAAPRESDNRAGFGGVVIYDGPSTKVIREIELPALPQGVFMREVSPGDFQFAGPLGGSSASTRKVSGLRSVTARYISVAGSPRLAVMLAMDGGVYEVLESASGVWQVRWMLPTEAYTAMRRRPSGTSWGPVDLAGNPLRFQPTYARRLDSGDVLLVNHYQGQVRERVETSPGVFSPVLSPFSGEVLVVDGSFSGAVAFGTLQPGYNVNRENLGFNSLSVLFELPPVQGIRGLVRPIFAERQ